MYGWIWHRLPFGWPGKLAGSVLLIAAAAALLWYLAFPAIDPYLPYNDGQVTTGNGTTSQDGVVPVSPSPTR
ncbi:MAG TPA: hypothetical protein VGJ07_31145 [Rugosimonospora sp.]|jgi:hypothetical protein